MEKVLIGLSGVVLGAILTVLKELFHNYRTRKKRAEYLAIRVVCMLDRFVSSCAAVVGDDGEMNGPDEQGCARLNTICPKIDFHSLDVDWQALPSNLMYDILNFPSFIEEADGKINDVFEYIAGPPDYGEGIEERQYQYAKIGIVANDLSTRLRRKYSIPSKVYENWNPIKFIEDNKAKLEKRRIEEERRSSGLQAIA
ncbi:MAG: hypothetical protein HY911_02620 [Desulfobacterales bacterium]|nr:hypothetical protein [Desulfobacterales bacterium]